MRLMKIKSIARALDKNEMRSIKAANISSSLGSGSCGKSCTKGGFDCDGLCNQCTTKVNDPGIYVCV